MAKILFVMTGADHWTLADGTAHPTGYWAEEFVAPYQAFTAAGHEVVVATPGGVVPTVDQVSLTPEVVGQDVADTMAAALRSSAELRSPIKLESAEAAEYIAMFYTGGHGPMEDLSADTDSARLLTEVMDAGKPVGVVCHGLAALLATERPDGTSPFTGYRVTGFTKVEEIQTGLADRAKWLLEDRLVALGVRFSAGEPWAPNVVVDRNVHTGQNPASSAPLAAELLKTLG
jgi:putative intracellular protease/amidase